MSVRIGSKKLCIIQRFKPVGLKQPQAFNFIKQIRTVFRNIIPSKNKYPAVTQYMKTSPERIFYGGLLVEPPAEHPVTDNQIQLIFTEMLCNIFQGIDNMLF